METAGSYAAWRRFVNTVNSIGGSVRCINILTDVSLFDFLNGSLRFGSRLCLRLQVQKAPNLIGPLNRVIPRH